MTTISVEQRRSIEKRLRAYYVKESQLEVKRSELEAAETLLRCLIEQSKSVTIDDPLRAIDYSVPVSTRGYIQSQIDRVIEVQGEVAERRISELTKEVYWIQEAVLEMERELAPMRRALSLLSEDARRLLEMHCMSRWSFNTIAIEIGNTSPSTLYRQYKDTLDQLATVLEQHDETKVK